MNLMVRNGKFCLSNAYDAIFTVSTAYEFFCLDSLSACCQNSSQGQIKAVSLMSAHLQFFFFLKNPEKGDLFRNI